MDQRKIEETLKRIWPAFLEAIKGLENRFREDFSAPPEKQGTDFFWGARARCVSLTEHWRGLPQLTAADLPPGHPRHLSALWCWACGFLVEAAGIYTGAGMPHEGECIRDACRRIIQLHPDVRQLK